MNLSRIRTASRGCRSTPRIAFTAKPATSRIRPRTSTGSRQKEAEVPIIRTCSWLGAAVVAALLAAPAPAAAKVRVAPDDPGLTYLQARAASMTGDHARAAALLATLAESQPDQLDLARKALSEAIGAGQMELALDLTKRIPAGPTYHRCQAAPRRAGTAPQQARSRDAVAQREGRQRQPGLPCALGDRLGGGAARRPRRGARRDRQDPGERLARPAARRRSGH